jgi:hypothetical protein
MQGELLQALTVQAYCRVPVSSQPRKYTDTYADCVLCNLLWRFRPGDAQQLPAVFVRSCLLLLLHTAANWLTWQQSPAGQEAEQEEAAAAAVQDILQMACCVLGPEKYLAATMHVWGQHQQHMQHQHQVQAGSAVAAAMLPVLCGCAPLLDQPDVELLSPWQQQQLAAALTRIAAEPAGLRLHAAVLMAAAISLPVGGSGSSSSAAASEAAAGDADEEAEVASQQQQQRPAQRWSKRDSKVGCARAAWMHMYVHGVIH